MSQTKTQLVEGLDLASAPADSLVIDSSGRVLVGTSSARSNFYNTTAGAVLQVEGLGGSGDSRRIAVIGSDNTAESGGGLLLAHQRSGSIGGNTILQSGDDIGVVTFQGNDGTDFVEAAVIEAEVDGTPGANDMPGRLVFSTTADGASSPTERMRISANGNITVDTNTFFVDAVNNRVGIGTTVPTFADGSGLEVQAAGTTTVRVDNSSAGSAGEFRADAVGTTIDCRGLEKFRVLTGGAERIRVDGNGLSIGIATQRSDFFNSTSVRPTFQIEGAGTDNRIASIVSNNVLSGAGAVLVLGHEKSGATGGDTAVANGDLIGRLSFQGNDGSTFVEAAVIESYCDNAVGTDDMPGRLVFSTTPDGSTSPTERTRITNSGAFKHTTTGSHVGATNITHTFNSNHNSAYTFEIRNQNNSFNSTHFGLHVDSTTTNGTYEFMRCTMGGVGTKFIILDSGNVQNTNNFYGALSDIKLKENIVDANSQWDDLKAIQVRNYNLKGETGHETHTQLGVVAQEVELISPGLVTESPDRDEDGNDLGTVTKSVNYSVLYMKAVKALQEAMERIETLETANASQAATIAALDARLTALEGG